MARQAKQRAVPSTPRRDRGPNRAPARSRNGLTVRQQEARQRAAHAVSLQRATRGLSLGQAARRAGTTPGTVLRYFGPYYQRERGRYRVLAADREPFLMTIISVEEGAATRVVRGSRRRALVGAHAQAIDQALRSGDDTALQRFRGKRVAGLTLLTDLDELTHQQRRGQLDFLEIYRTSN